MMSGQKVAFVTGGAQGIGACISDKLCSLGYYVVLCDKDEEKGRRRESILRGKGYDSTFIRGDVSKPDDMERIAATIRRKWEKLDVIVNNAGIADPEMDFPTRDVSRWKEVIETNLSGAYYAVNFLLELMPPGSSIVNIASTRAFQSEKNTLGYSASKGGIVALTHSLSITLSDRRVRVNSISPGWIDTSLWQIPEREPQLSRIDHEQHPSKRVGRPEDVAELTSFLCSEAGEWINGENIIIDGGMTKRMIYLDDQTIREIRGEGN